jgi:hypothetical protein
MGLTKLHDRIQLYIDDGTIILAPQESEDVLIIDRVTFKVELQGKYPILDWESGRNACTLYKIVLFKVSGKIDQEDGLWFDEHGIPLTKHSLQQVPILRVAGRGLNAAHKNIATF